MLFERLEEGKVPNKKITFKYGIIWERIGLDGVLDPLQGSISCAWPWG